MNSNDFQVTCSKVMVKPLLWANCVVHFIYFNHLLTCFGQVLLLQRRLNWNCTMGGIYVSETFLVLNRFFNLLSCVYQVRRKTVLVLFLFIRRNVYSILTNINPIVSCVNLVLTCVYSIVTCVNPILSFIL